MTAPVSAHEQNRRRVLAEAYSFALNVARRETGPVASEPQPDPCQASEQATDDRQ